MSGNDDVVTLTPVAQPLAANATFTIEVSTAATDRAGNALTAARTFTFTTASPDTIPPKVASIDPPDNAVDVSLATPITVTFTEAVDPATVTAQSFRVRIDGGPVTGIPERSSAAIHVARFTPDAPLPTEAVIVTELTGGITDAFGNPLVAADGSALVTPLTFTFVTGRFSLTSPAGAAGRREQHAAARGARERVARHRQRRVHGERTGAAAGVGSALHPYVRRRIGERHAVADDRGQRPGRVRASRSRPTSTRSASWSA